MRRAQDRARSATIKSRALGALRLARKARDENVPAKRADFCCWNPYDFQKKVQYTVIVFTEYINNDYSKTLNWSNYTLIAIPIDSYNFAKYKI